MNFEEITVLPTERGESPVKEQIANPKTWLEYKANLKRNVEVITVPNYLNFEIEDLVIEEGDFPKLKELRAENCALFEIRINCHSLENLWLNNNLLTKIDLNGVKNIKNLVISNNRLKDLDVSFLKNLESLWCFKNSLERLDCSGLTKLVDLNCSGNIYETILVPGKGNLLMGMNEIIFNSVIEFLDCDMNHLDSKNLDLSNLTNLKKISLRQNNLKQYQIFNSKWEKELFSEYDDYDKTLILNSPYLTHIDIKLSDIKEIIYQTPLLHPEKLRLIDNNTDEANWHQDAPTWWEQDAYIRQQQQYRGEQTFYEGQDNISFFFTLEGELNLVQGWNMIAGQLRYLPTSTKLLNLGNNNITKLTISNFVNLETLIVSHNNLQGEVKIINCPRYESKLKEEQAKLKEITPRQQDSQEKVLYDYKHNAPTPTIEWDFTNIRDDKEPVKESNKEENKPSQPSLPVEQATITPVVTTAVVNKGYWKESLIFAGVGLTIAFLFWFKKRKFKK